MKQRDPIRPLIGVGVTALLYWVTLNLLLPPMRFLGGEMMALTVTTLLAASIASALGMAIFESRSLGDLGLAWHPGAGQNLLTGVAAGVAGALLVVLPPVALGLAHFELLPRADVSWRGAMFAPLLLFCGAAGEEILFRGFALQYLMRGWGPSAAIFSLGALFGLLHASNPGATALGTLNTAGFGVLFGLAFLRTHDLWLPLGIHFGWNTTLPFLGVELSGLTIKVAGYHLVWKAGDLWSGGKYGPEASLLASLVLAGMFVVVWKVPVRRGWAFLVDTDPDPEPGT